MFREMRRYKQLLSKERAEEMLTKATSGVLALHGDDDYPYAVPVSYVYDDGHIYFHGASQGHKMDSIRRDAKASFCVIDTDQVLPEDYTTAFRSVICFGVINVISDDEKRREIGVKIGERYWPGHLAEANAEVDAEWNNITICDFSIEHMTAKEAIEFVRMREEDL